MGLIQFKIKIKKYTFIQKEIKNVVIHFKC